MYLSNIDTMDELVAYRQESVAASIRASLQDSLLMAGFKVRVGMLLIQIGERLGSSRRGEVTLPATTLGSPPWSRRCPSCV
jgi:hypothetical protein